MADAHKNFKIRRVARQGGEWTPIVVPAGEFSRVQVLNTDGTAGAFRTDKDDQTTEKPIAATTGELEIRADKACFNEGDVVGYFWLAAATSPIVSFTR